MTSTILAGATAITPTRLLPDAWMAGAAVIQPGERARMRAELEHRYHDARRAVEES